jgi:hypothetical protein
LEVATINIAHPLNFDPKDKRFDIFADHEFEFSPTPKIEIVRNARIGNNSVVFKWLCFRTRKQIKSSETGNQLLQNG